MQKWHFVLKITLVTKKNFFKFKSEGQDFEKKIEITGTIYSNIETECFFSGGFSDQIH